MLHTGRRWPRCNILLYLELTIEDEESIKIRTLSWLSSRNSVVRKLEVIGCRDYQ